MKLLMLWENVYTFVQLILAYALLTAALPAICLHGKLKKEGLIYRLLFYNIISNLYIISAAYFLGYLKIVNRLTMILCIVCIPLIIKIFTERKNLERGFQNLLTNLSELSKNEYGYRLYLKKIRKRVFQFFGRVWKLLFAGKIFEWIFFLCLIIFVVFFFGYYRFHYYGFGHTDEETHIYWIQSYLSGKIFPMGMYPHGTHNVIAAITLIFGLNPVRGALCFSVVSTVMNVTILYLILRQLLKSKYAAFFGVAVFVVGNIFQKFTYIRYQFLFPMEYGLAAMVIMLYALVLYIWKKEKKHLFLFAASLSLTFAIHFYITMFAAVICLVFGMVHVIRIFRRRMFIPLVAASLLSILFSTVPFAAGFMLGYDFEQSIAWGFRMMEAGGDAEEEEEEEEARESKANNGNEAVNGAGTGAENTVKQSLSDKIKAAANNTTAYIAEDFAKNRKVASAMLLLEGLGLLYALAGLLFGKDKLRYQLYLSMMLLWGVNMLLYLAYWFGWPKLFEMKRSTVFMAYISAFIITIPLELFHNLMSLSKFGRRITNGLEIFSIFALVFLLLHGRLYKTDLTYWTIQSDPTMKLCLDLLDTGEDGKWTVVSPVDELATIQNNGFHYEILDFAQKLDEWEPDQKIYIPTKDVYFAIEKYPIKFFERNVDGSNAREFLTHISEKLAQEELPDLDTIRNRLYFSHRDIIMSKVYYWAEAYKKHFPHEMSVYYEDDDIVIYKVAQDEYALNNFAMNYKDGFH